MEVRLEGVQTGRLAGALRRSEELHGLLWSHAVAGAEQAPGSIMAGLLIQSLNEMIDLHTTRLQAGLRSRVPGTIWTALDAVAILGVASMGYHTGLSGTRRSFALLPLALAFSAVMLLIADLDRPQQGLLRVSQQAMIDLRDSLQAQNR